MGSARASEEAVGAVDIGGTKIAVGIIDDDGEILSPRESPTRPDDGFEAAMSRIADMLRQSCTESGRSIKGIGIGCTGPVDPITGEIGDVEFLPGWTGNSVTKALGERLGSTTAIENDADAAALGEARWGAGRGKNSMICVMVGTGIGAGVVLNGRIYRGASQSHPELGHHVLDSSGPRCYCGARGCWEALAAGPAMVDWVVRSAPKDYPHRDGLTAERICLLATRGEPLAIRAVEREARFLGLGIANLVTLFVPDGIILGGGVMKSAELFLPVVREYVARNCGLVPHQKTKIGLGSLGENIGLVGAGAVWYSRYTSLRD